MLKIAVVDDVKQICSEVEEFILSFGKKECVCVDVDVFYDGLGIINVREAVKKYKGLLKMSHEDNVFTAQVLVYI